MSRQASSAAYARHASDLVKSLISGNIAKDLGKQPPGPTLAHYSIRRKPDVSYSGGEQRYLGSFGGVSRASLRFPKRLNSCSFRPSFVSILGSKANLWYFPSLRFLYSKFTFVLLPPPPNPPIFFVFDGMCDWPGLCLFSYPRVLPKY